MSEIILHHYATSVFSERVRLEPRPHVTCEHFGELGVVTAVPNRPHRNPDPRRLGCPRDDLLPQTDSCRTDGELVRPFTSTAAPRHVRNPPR